MKRIVSTMALTLVVIVAVAALLFSQSLYSPGQAALNRYVRHFNSLYAEIRVKSVTQAHHPRQFSAEVSGPVFGESVYYGTHPNQGQRPLPYPPDELWCALLGAGDGNKVVFVALHVDLFNAEWLVHESNPTLSNDGLETQLAAIGCDLNLAQ